MSILIKGMEMPNEGAERCIVIRGDGTIRTFTGALIDYATAIPVPPHGRLIDADALEDKCRRLAMDKWNTATGTNWGYAYATFGDDVEGAPTIIEAEGEE